MSARCRYRQVPCNGPGTTDFSLCHESSCPGPVEAVKPTKKSEEVKPAMPRPEKPTRETCPECKRPDLILYACKYLPDYHEPGAKVCPRCSAKFANRAKSAAKAPVAAPAKAATPCKIKAKITAPVPPPPAPILTRTDLAGAPTRSSARLVFSLPIPAGTTALELMDLLRSVPSTAVVEG